MLTKKQLIERLKDVPDDALIGEIQYFKRGISFNIFWKEENNHHFIENIMKDAAYIPLQSNIKLFEILKK